MKIDAYKFSGFLLCIVICLPYLVLGENSYITIHDFLDSTISHIVNIVNNGCFFDLGAKIPFLEGLDRYSIPFSTPFELKALLFVILPPYWAIVANIVLVKVMAFLGMYLLLDEYLTPNHKFLSFAISIIFSLVPFYVDYGISSAGIPLVSYALINLYYGKKVVGSYALVTLYAFYSTLALSGFFVCFLLFLVLIILWYEYKQINVNLLSSLFILIVFYIAANGNMIKENFISLDYISHREEWVTNYSFVEMLRRVFTNVLLTSQYHAGSFVAFPILVGYLIVHYYYKNKYKILSHYTFCFIILVVLILFGTFAKLLPFKIFTSFQFDRFYFLYPAMCFILLAKASEILFREKKTYIMFLLLICTFGCVGIKNVEMLKNWLGVIHLVKAEPSYKQFYDEDLYNIICRDLGVKQDYTTRVASLGMFPSIPEYNGFYCLDAYVNSYLLDYKHKFRKVIAKELAKDDALKSYFDDWGSRCYVFSAELKDKGNQFLCSKKDDISVNHLDINTKALKDLGCEYILSAVDIKNYKDLNLAYINSYTTDQSYWNIRVYRLNKY